MFTLNYRQQEKSQRQRSSRANPATGCKYTNTQIQIHNYRQQERGSPVQLNQLGIRLWRKLASKRCSGVTRWISPVRKGITIWCWLDWSSWELARGPMWALWGFEKSPLMWNNLQHPVPSRSEFVFMYLYLYLWGFEKSPLMWTDLQHTSPPDLIPYSKEAVELAWFSVN